MEQAGKRSSGSAAERQPLPMYICNENFANALPVIKVGVFERIEKYNTSRKRRWRRLWTEHSQSQFSTKSAQKKEIKVRASSTDCGETETVVG